MHLKQSDQNFDIYCTFSVLYTVQYSNVLHNADRCADASHIHSICEYYSISSKIHKYFRTKRPVPAIRKAAATLNSSRSFAERARLIAMQTKILCTFRA